MVFCNVAGVAVLSLVVLTSCASREAKPIEDLTGARDVSIYTLRSLQGTRDGDRLDVKALYGNGVEGVTVDLVFKVTPPTRLESGSWSGLGGKGSVQERSVTFLGGQSGPPSIGGRFALIGPEGTAVYLVSIPLQPLKNPL